MESIIQKMVPPNNVPVSQLARDTCINAAAGLNLLCAYVLLGANLVDLTSCEIISDATDTQELSFN